MKRRGHVFLFALMAFALCPWFPPAAGAASNAGADSFWAMDLSDFAIEDIETRQRLWQYIVQPVVVADIGPKEHLYPVREPGASAKDEAAVTGQIHGTTQGLHVLERRDGWALVEYYSNDGQGAPFQSTRQFAGLRVSGWVPENKLKTVHPNQTIGLVIDKLHQKMYIFEAGEMTGELLVSTGEPTEKFPYYETPAGEFLIDSWVGLFNSYGLQCDMAIRINGGVLLHEVPFEELADGTRRYTKFEQNLGRKASHGCVRVQRTRNGQGQNMQWLWKNLKRGAKVLILEDSGRALPPPDMNAPVYYNPNNGQNFHGDPYCSHVLKRHLPLAMLTLADLYAAPYDALTPCPYCAPPQKPQTPDPQLPDASERHPEEEAESAQGEQSAPESGFRFIMYDPQSGAPPAGGAQGAMGEWTYPVPRAVLEDPQDVLRLINRDNLLDKTYPDQSAGLYKMIPVTVPATKNEEHTLRGVVNEALTALVTDAAAQDIRLYVGSAYRNYRTQEVMHYNREKRLEFDDGVVQMAGASEHQAGLAVDLVSWEYKDGFETSFGGTKEGQWLAANCARHGFILRYPEGKTEITGVRYEPWHLRYVGGEAAAYITQTGLTLEEFTEEWQRELMRFDQAQRQ